MMTSWAAECTQLANADYKGNEYSGYAEVGYKLDLGGVVVIQPMAAFQVAYLMQDSYMETGAGDLNLIVDSRATSSYQSYLGVHISKASNMVNFVLKPDARVKWAHEFSSDEDLINARFSSSGSRSFTVVSACPNRDTAIAGVGLTGGFNKNLSMYIQYDAELNSDYVSHTGMIGLRFSW
jgi:outer membrane autotransporter protein